MKFPISFSANSLILSNEISETGVLRFYARNDFDDGKCEVTATGNFTASSILLFLFLLCSS